MRHLPLAVLIIASVALSGCFGDDDNDYNPPDRVNTDVAKDQADAKLAVKRVNAVIDASNDVNTDEPQDIDRIILPAANLAEPVAIKNANASL